MFDAEQIKHLNDLELLVYEYVVKHPNQVKYMRIRELASEVHVSTSTILRFCKKMGCSGYAEFKLQFREHLNKKEQVPIRDDISEVIDFLKKTSSEEFENKLDMLAKVIFEADNVFLVGSGMSGIVAKYGARYFSSMGKFCLYIDEPHYPTESRFVDNSFVIVFSVSGESRDTISHVTRFKEKNCQILSITNTENCTIAKLSDYNIAYYVSYMKLKDYDVTTQIPAISIVERLGKKLYQNTVLHIKNK
ncbi:MAG: MurR/RpiR family transcriptional regulator [Lachnospiraceae bacterium]|jgi:DNA-binding MurR/RpiR family transcriptional regulator